MNIELDQVWLQALTLTALRFTIFMVIAPPFNHASIPARAKAMIGLGLALAVTSKTGENHQLLDTMDYFMAATAELFTGALMGMLVMTLFSAFQTAGSMIDLMGGFQVAQVFDPGTNVNGAQFARIFQFGALVLLFSTGAYQVILAGLMRSYDGVPLGTWPVLGTPVENLMEAGSAMLIAALQIAGPLMAILFLSDVGLGLVTRAAPALNAFVLGFPLKIFITLTYVSIVFGLIPFAMSSLVEQAVNLMGEVNNG